MIQIFKSKGQWYVRHVAANGKILSISEGFRTKKSAWKNINATAAIYKKGFVKDIGDVTPI